MSQILQHTSQDGASTIVFDDGTRVFRDKYQDLVVVMYNGCQKETILPRSAATHPILSRPEVAELKVDGSRDMTGDEETDYEVAFEGTGYR